LRLPGVGLMSAVGFLVWNPSRSVPTRVHDTIERALAEAERLTQANPGERFVVMSPVMSGSDATVSKAWSDGKAEGYAEARREVMQAEAVSDRLGEQLHAMRHTKALIDNIAEHQAAVADCICWFDGFAAAHSPRESWERPHLPDRERIRALNAALQRLLPSSAADLDDEIPF